MKIKKIIPVILITFNILTIYAQLSTQKSMRSAFLQGELSHKDYVVAQGYLMYSEEKFKEKFPQFIPYNPNKCGTFINIELKKMWEQLTEEEKAFFEESFKPAVLDRVYDSPSGFFRIHYTMVDYLKDKVPTQDSDSDGVPDYVEEVANAFDYSLEYETNIGFNYPPIDPFYGDNKYHINIVDLDGGMYGQTVPRGLIPDLDHAARYSYIDIENDFSENFYTKGIDAVKVTAAHELNHAIQFGYIEKWHEVYLYETTSVWLEESVYPEINDYFQYLPSFYNDITSRFDTRNYLHEYGNGLWGIFLENKFGPQVLVKTWEYLVTMNSFRALDRSLRENGSNFDVELSEYYTNLFFAFDKGHLNPYFDDAEEFPGIETFESIITLNPGKSSIDTSIVIQSRAVSPTYIKVNSVSPITYKIDGAVAVEDAGYYINKVVFYNGIDNYNVFDMEFLTGTGSSISLSSGYANSYAILVPVCVAETDKSGGYLQSFMITLQESAEKPTNQFLTPVPNPFILGNGEKMKMPFVLVESEEVEAFIYNSAGQLINSFFLGLLEEGYYDNNITWDGKDKNGYDVSSGIYIGVLKVGKDVYRNKFAVVKN